VLLRHSAAPARLLLIPTCKEETMTFHKGKSGNPGGRPRGARNKATILLENLVQGDTEAVARMLTAMTKGGRIVSLRVCMQPRPAGESDAPGESPEAERSSAHCISP
jgi:hypothetical protein